MWQLESYKEEEEVEEEEAVPEENEPQPNKEQRVKNQINHCKVWQICVQRNPKKKLKNNIECQVQWVLRKPTCRNLLLSFFMALCN